MFDSDFKRGKSALGWLAGGEVGGATKVQLNSLHEEMQHV